MDLLLKKINQLPAWILIPLTVIAFFLISSAIAYIWTFSAFTFWGGIVVAFVWLLAHSYEVQEREKRELYRLLEERNNENN